MSLFKAVAAETDATNMAEATPLAEVTQVVDEGPILPKMPLEAEWTEGLLNESGTD